jgi:hypothetical protein
VLQPGHRLGFGLKALQVRQATGVETFQSDESIESAVSRLPDDAHAAAAEQTEYLIAGDVRGGTGSGGQLRVAATRPGRLMFRFGFHWPTERRQGLIAPAIELSGLLLATRTRCQMLADPQDLGFG